MATDPRASSALCAALADLAEEARLPRDPVARITSAIMDIFHGQSANIERLERRLRRQNNAIDQLLSRLDRQHDAIERLERLHGDVGRGTPANGSAGTDSGPRSAASPHGAVKDAANLPPELDERHVARKAKEKSGSSSGTKLEEPPGIQSSGSLAVSSSQSNERNSASDASVPHVSATGPLRPLPSLDEVLRDTRRHRQERRAEARKRDRDFMAPCAECCAAQRRKLTDANGNVHEKKYARFVVRPGACHHFRHLDESVDSKDRDRRHDLSFPETETQSPEEKVEDSQVKRRKVTKLDGD